MDSVCLRVHLLCRSQFLLGRAEKILHKILCCSCCCCETAVGMLPSGVASGIKYDGVWAVCYYRNSKQTPVVVSCFDVD